MYVNTLFSSIQQWMEGEFGLNSQSVGFFWSKWFVGICAYYHAVLGWECVGSGSKWRWLALARFQRLANQTYLYNRFFLGDLSSVLEPNAGWLE